MHATQNPWLLHVDSYRRSHPGVDYKTALQMASMTYNKMGPGKTAAKKTAPKKMATMKKKKPARKPLKKKAAPRPSSFYSFY